MKFIGDINLIGDAEIINMKTEKFESDPSFDPAEAGRIIYNSTTNEYKFNNGTDWVAFESNAVSASTTLRSTLGTEWINSDLSFNPTPLNALDNVSGLNANDSLYDVLTQFDTAITNSLTVVQLQGVDLNFTSGELSPNNIIYFNGSDFVPGTINDLDTAEVAMDEITDTAFSSISDDQVLMYSDSEWVNRSLIFQYQDLTGLASSFVVNHNLGTQFVHVTVIDYSTTSPSKIDPSLITSIEYITEHRVDVNLTVNKPVVILVTGMQLTPA